MPPEVHSVLGASAADRWMNCTPSAQLTAGMQDEGSSFAAEGTAAHALCEWKVRRALKMRAGKRPTSDYWTDEMEEFTDAYRDYIIDLVGQAKQNSLSTVVQGFVNTLLRNPGDKLEARITPTGRQVVKLVQNQGPEVIKKSATKYASGKL